MKRKFLSVTMAAVMMLTGCASEVENNNSSNKGSENKEEKRVEKNISGENSIALTDIQAKYATVTTANIIEPLYNVAPDEEFEFKFKYNLTNGGYGIEDIVSVHTHIDCKPESLVYTKNTPEETNDGGSLLRVAPISAIMETEYNEEDYWENDHVVWGNAPIYYIAIWYDMENEELTKLDKPIVIPFTIKHEVEAPEVRGVVDANGCFSLQWDPVEGASEYRIYTLTNSLINHTGEINEAIEGAENGYQNASLLYMDTVEGDKNTYMNFAGEGGNMVKFERNVSGKEYVISQNPCVNGEYYVSAVVDGKESGFACSVETAHLQIPYMPTRECDIMFSRYTSVDDLPLTLDVVNIDGSVTARNVFYTFQMEDTYLEGVQTPEYAYRIEGTAITGCVSMDVEEPNYEYPETIGESSQTGMTTPEDEIKSQPDADIVTIPEDAPDDGSVIENQIDDSEENAKKEAEDASVSTSGDYMVFADSAAEEWIALNMVQGKQEISLAAFPELQTKDMLLDTFLKVYNQNPYVLGLYKYQYDYCTKTLHVQYVYTDEELKQRQKEIYETAQELIDELIEEDMSEEEKQKAIYLYLEENTEYDNAALEEAAANDYKKIAKADFEDSFNTYGILVEKIGVCQSYAHVYKLLCTMAGLKCDIATGYLNGNLPHAWNFVEIDGQWYQSDSTNNAKITGIPFYLYNADTDTACLTGFTCDDQFALDDNLDEYVTDDDQYEYYNTQGLCADNMEDFGDILVQELEENAELIFIRYDNDLPTKEEMEKELSKVFNKLNRENELDAIAYFMTDGYIILKTK